LTTLSKTIKFQNLQVSKNEFMAAFQEALLAIRDLTVKESNTKDANITGKLLENKMNANRIEAKM